MTLAERTIRTQREALMNAHNTRFEMNGKEYIIRYEGGIAEFIGVYCRAKNNHKYTFEKGFAGYKMRTTEQIIEKAKELVSKT